MLRLLRRGCGNVSQRAEQGRGEGAVGAAALFAPGTLDSKKTLKPMAENGRPT